MTKKIPDKDKKARPAVFDRRRYMQQYMAKYRKQKAEERAAQEPAKESAKIERPRMIFIACHRSYP